MGCTQFSQDPRLTTPEYVKNTFPLNPADMSYYTFLEDDRVLCLAVRPA